MTRLEADADSTRLAEPLAPRPPARPPATASTGWLTSSDSIDHGRFQPGAMLGGRYRIVGRLGRGGMGEVYRADDLKLGQPVALKFLPAEVDRDPARLSQLHTEVRMARQVSHPNVCRVYDIDEVDGHTFLSMEYVDGEDLASILRRFGRFTEERALEIARQVCAGLAAAHERGVIHRDFKPANVMIDGTGRVRITDFGLAGAAGETIRAGTPAYMAPEQLAGEEVTARSDIYALGLVLYEIFTGQRALEGKNLAELIRRRAEAEITPPSALVTNLSPEIDRAVMRCLAPDPTHRPASALGVAASLPGGDPLAAALAAGETPSPEMVAAAGEAGTLSHPVGATLLAFVVIGLLIGGWQSDRTLLVGRVALDTPVQVLEVRAREAIAAAGHDATVADTALGIGRNDEMIGWVLRNDQTPTRWQALESGHVPAMRFWYRTSPQPLAPLAPTWNPGLNDPPLGLSGMASVVVDERGRLLEYITMPPQRDEATDAPPPAIDWAPLFAAAGLDSALFAPAAPEWTPRTYADQRQAWTGVHPEVASLPLRVEASAYRGTPVSFQVIWPWTQAARMAQQTQTTLARAMSIAGTVFLLAMIAGALALVRYNLKSRRADLRGATRVACVLLVIWFVAWALGTRHSLSLPVETQRFFAFLAGAVMNTAVTWVFYLALEPLVRRYWPDLVISWNRLLAGQFRDPRVGRDILAGLAAGVFLNLARLTFPLLPGMVGDAPPPIPGWSSAMFLLGARFTASAVLASLPNALQTAMSGAFVFVMLSVLVGRMWLATAITVLLFGGLIFAESGFEMSWLMLVVIAAFTGPIMFVFLRFGLVALITVLLVNQTLVNAPLTIDLLKPHAAVSAWAMLALAAIGAWAFHTSRGGSQGTAAPVRSAWR